MDKRWCRVIFGLRKVAKYGPSDILRFPKGFFFQKVQFVFQISQSPKKNIPKNYPELEI